MFKWLILLLSLIILCLSATCLCSCRTTNVITDPTTESIVVDQYRTEQLKTANDYLLESNRDAIEQLTEIKSSALSIENSIERVIYFFSKYEELTSIVIKRLQQAEELTRTNEEPVSQD